MRLRTRLVLFGALLPLVALAIAVVGAGWWLRRGLREDLDRHLLAQAAVESVGLFDSPTGRPHTHVHASPLAAAVVDIAADAAVYDDHGARVSEVPQPDRVPATLRLTQPIGAPVIADDPIADRRVLTLRVIAPDGHTYGLWLGVGFGMVDDTMARYYRATGLALGGLALALMVLQLTIAGRLARRVTTMIGFLPRMRAGDDGGGLPADPGRDELAALRDALRASAARLAEARDEQDRLIANAAHELRTPLTVMRTELDLALRRERTPDELREALVAVRADADRLGVLASEMLDLQAVRHLGFGRRDGDLGDLAREACAAIRTLAEAHDVALVVTAPDDAAARFDERAIRQAVDNLLGNALRHAPRGSTVDLAITRQAEGWRLAVSDHGPGIPADEAERVFEPFQRLGASRGGGGLGLTIVREVARRHGGHAWVERDHGPGAMVCIFLPDDPRRPATA